MQTSTLIKSLKKVGVCVDKITTERFSSDSDPLVTVVEYIVTGPIYEGHWYDKDGETDEVFIQRLDAKEKFMTSDLVLIFEYLTKGNVKEESSNGRHIGLA